jgi:hypothetical protein
MIIERHSMRHFKTKQKYNLQIFPVAVDELPTTFTVFPSYDYL